MHWFQTLDVTLFRWVNRGLSNPAFDVLMPIVSGNDWSKGLLIALAIVAAVLLCWKGGRRGRLCLLMLGLVLAVGDGFICNTIKHAVGRARPFLVLPDAHCLAGRSHSGSMPSSHAANWFSAMMVLFLYYRRSAWFMLPMAALVAFSRVYNGVHFPSDVAAGAVLGAGYALATLLMADTLWNWAGRRWFPLWWEKLPSLANPKEAALNAQEEPQFAPRKRANAAAGLAPGSAPSQGLQARHVSPDEHWLRLGYLCIGLLLLARLLYLASGTIQLAEDEAYQWLWSKHLALSYYSKPPLIAYTQFLGTSLWGDTAFGIRFLSPVITAIMSLVLLRFFARQVNARAGFFLLLIATATPLLSLGAVLMTIDPLSVLFWTAAMLAGWHAIQPKGRTQDWLWVGLWLGLGFLSKYTELLQLVSWVVLFVLWRPARQHLRRPGPYLALLINLLALVPVAVWNAQHGWVTVIHVAADAGVNTAWHPTLKFVLDFLGVEFALLNPVFFVAAAWAAIAFWRRERHNPRLVYFFSMGAPLFLIYLGHAFRARNLPNWIAPAVVPLFCLMVVYWDTRLRLGQARIKGWLTTGLVLGFAIVLAAHNTDVWKVTLPARRALACLIPKTKASFKANFTRPYLPVNWDPLHRVRVWTDMARTVGQAREKLAAEGKPTFIIADHYGLTSLISFYLPEAKARILDGPLVFCRSSERVHNQFAFWPGYEDLHGENAVYIRELDRGSTNRPPAPKPLLDEFESVTQVGVSNVMYHGQVCRPLEVFFCRGLK